MNDLPDNSSSSAEHEALGRDLSRCFGGAGAGPAPAPFLADVRRRRTLRRVRAAAFSVPVVAMVVAAVTMFARNGPIGPEIARGPGESQPHSSGDDIDRMLVASRGGLSATLVPRAGERLDSPTARELLRF